MDRLWSPWRYRYVSAADPAGACVFCVKSQESEDEKNLIVHRGKHNFILLNLFPYTSGHLMVAPYAHIATLEDASEETVTELMLLTRLSQAKLREVYKVPDLTRA